uniref:Uncharacterized protein n=1 Tax=Arundo donax TaxID=35708 RepID=A0A0A8XRL3_ARUDO
MRKSRIITVLCIQVPIVCCRVGLAIYIYPHSIDFEQKLGCT